MSIQPMRLKQLRKFAYKTTELTANDELILNAALTAMDNENELDGMSDIEFCDLLCSYLNQLDK